MKDFALRLLMVAGWTAVLPLLGYLVIGILTILPLLGVFAGPRILMVIYLAGAVPAFVTAVGFEFAFRHWGLKRSLVACIALGMAVTFAWVGLSDILSSLVQRQNYYVIFALAMTGALPAALMPVTRFAKDRRSFG
jgi:hypothetical protein